MPQPGIIEWVQSLLDQYREACRHKLFEQIQVTTDPPQRLILCILLYEGHDFKGVNVLIVNLIIGAQIGTRLKLVSLPTPIRHHHRKVGWCTIVELLILMTNAHQFDLPRDRRWIE